MQNLTDAPYRKRRFIGVLRLLRRLRLLSNLPSQMHRIWRCSTLFVQYSGTSTMLENTLPTSTFRAGNQAVKSSFCLVGTFFLGRRRLWMLLVHHFWNVLLGVNTHYCLLFISKRSGLFARENNSCTYNGCDWSGSSVAGPLREKDRFESYGYGLAPASQTVRQTGRFWAYVSH